MVVVALGEPGTAVELLGINRIGLSAKKEQAGRSES
jgi:hypothetical protein